MTLQKIEFVYLILTTEGDEETICGFGSPTEMQCCSSRLDTLKKVLQNLQGSPPSRDFRIVKFWRVEE